MQCCVMCPRHHLKVSAFVIPFRIVAMMYYRVRHIIRITTCFTPPIYTMLVSVSTTIALAWVSVS